MKREETKKEQNDNLLNLAGHKRQDSAVSVNENVLKASLELRRKEEGKAKLNEAFEEIKGEGLLKRSERCMDFNVEEFDEYIVSDDDEEEVKNIEVEVNLKKELTPQKNNAENSSRPCLSSPSVNLSNRAGSMIFKPFRPGQKHSAFE